jgi:hypothetical protein
MADVAEVTQRGASPPPPSRRTGVLLVKALAPLALVGIILLIPRPEAVEPAGWTVSPSSRERSSG